MASSPHKFLFCPGSLLDIAVTTTVHEYCGSETKKNSKLRLVAHKVHDEDDEKSKADDDHKAPTWENICTISVNGIVHCAAVSPSGKRLVVGGANFLTVSSG
eukprot:5761742-Pyramimonas_sp.AAC.1